MKITTIGLDLAKEKFQVHGVDKRGVVVVRRRLTFQPIARLKYPGHTC